MFTAMVRRSVVWLLAALGLLGVGWLAFEQRPQGPGEPAVEAGDPPPARQALAPDVADGDRRGADQVETAAVEPEDAAAGEPEKGPPPAAAPSPPAVAPSPPTVAPSSPAVAPSPAVSSPASPPDPDERAVADAEGRGSPDTAASVPPVKAERSAAVQAPPPRPAPAASVAPLASTEAAPEAETPAPAPPEPAIAAIPAPSSDPPSTQPGPEAATPSPETTATRPGSAETPRAASAPEPAPPSIARTPDPDWPRLGDLAPGAGPAPPESAAVEKPTPSDAPAAPEVAVASARTTPPDEPAGADIAATEPPVAAAPEARPVEPERVPDRAPPKPPYSEVAPSAPEPAAEPPARSSLRALMADTIKRALAAILGGPLKEPGPRPEVVSPEPPDRGEARPAEPARPPEPVAPVDMAARERPAQTGAGAPAGEPRVAAVPRAAPAEVVRPSFDIVRVEPDGRAVIAGRAEPGADVEVRAGDRVIDRVRADRRGEWVATPLAPLPPGGQELTLIASRAGAPQLESEEVVVIAVPEPSPQPAEIAPATTPVAVLLARDGVGRGRVLQAPGRISSDGRLALMVLDYDDSGRIRLSGQAPPGAPIRIYVDNQPSAEVVTPPSGEWTVVLDQRLAPGTYTLRLDQIDPQGRPVARLETPFTRASQPPDAGDMQVDYVIVQPGNSLWRIARRLFGSGIKYVHIYEANQAQIRDPDLIYPGQVFEIPAALGSAG